MIRAWLANREQHASNMPLPRHLHAALDLRIVTSSLMRDIGSETGLVCGSVPPALYQVLAALRNLVIGLIRRAGHSNVAAALRRHTAHLGEAFAMVGLTDATGE